MEIRFQPWDPSRAARTFRVSRRTVRWSAFVLAASALAGAVGLAGLPAIVEDLGRAAERLALHQTALRGSEAFVSVKKTQERLADRIAADELFLARVAIASGVALPIGFAPGEPLDEGLAPEAQTARLSRRVWEFEALRRAIAAQVPANGGRRTPSISPVAPSAAVPVATYGIAASPLTRTVEFFPGLALAVPEGTRVIATAEGTVAFVGRAPGGCGAAWRALGLVVVMQHDASTWTVYGNLERASVRRGARLSRGDQIGLAGRGSLRPSPQVHYEVRRLESDAIRPLDPRHFILDAEWISPADFPSPRPPDDDTLPRELR